MRESYERGERDRDTAFDLRRKKGCRRHNDADADVLYCAFFRGPSGFRFGSDRQMAAPAIGFRKQTHRRRNFNLLSLSGYKSLKTSKHR